MDTIAIQPCNQCSVSSTTSSPIHLPTFTCAPPITIHLPKHPSPSPSLPLPYLHRPPPSALPFSCPLCLFPPLGLFCSQRRCSCIRRAAIPETRRRTSGQCAGFVASDHLADTCTTPSSPAPGLPINYPGHAVYQRARCRQMKSLTRG